jgi:hypothetical protein
LCRTHQAILDGLGRSPRGSGSNLITGDSAML